MPTLLDELAQVFPPKPLAASIFIDNHSQWRSYPHAAQFEAGCDGRSWNDLAIPFLNFHEDALRWLPPAAFVEIVPAYFAALVHPESTYNLLMTTSLLIHLIRRPRWAATFDARLNLINQAQRKVMVKVLENLLREDYEPGWIHATLGNLRDLPENDPVRARMPDGPTTPVLPLPLHYAHLEQELLAAFPPETFRFADIAQWKNWVDRGSMYPGNTSLEQGIAGRVWGSISIEFIQIHEHALLVLKPEGFAALVPAYLAALLYNKREMMSLVYPSLLRCAENDLGFATRTERLNRAQRQALVHVFAALDAISGLPGWFVTKEDQWVAKTMKSAYKGWCSVVEGPPNVETLSTPLRPQQFETHHLIQRIRDVFPRKIMSTAAILQSLNPEKIEYLVDDDLKVFLDVLNGHTWDTLSPSVLTHYSIKLRGLERDVPEAAVAVLPAYLVQIAYGDDEPTNLLRMLERRESESPDQFLALRLDADQCRVVVHVLEAMVHKSHPYSRFDGENAKAILPAWRAACGLEEPTS